jgi:hypothetical protein
MKIVLQLEELAQLAAAILLLSFLPLELAWWIIVLLFFAPDISIMAYIVNSRFGAVVYNLFHHKGTAALIAGTGLVTGDIILQAGGLILWGHSSFDRVWGYGLKYADSFKHTHLGPIGK